MPQPPIDPLFTALPSSCFTRLDESPAESFDANPRSVTTIHDTSSAALTQLRREYFPAGGAVLDLMSSWISHLPHDVSYRRVVGLGLNAEELAANTRLDAWIVQNLNETPRLPFETGDF